LKKYSIHQTKEIYNRELEYLEDGILNSKNPYHFFSLSTLNIDYPESRTIVLRDIKKKPLKILFNADFRSPKVKQLIKNPNCTALFYDNNRKMQLRFKCQSTINHKNKLAKKIWGNTPLQSRKCYMGDYSPSELTNCWEPNIPDKYFKKDPERVDSELGYKNFTAIELFIMVTDILELHHDGHIRFRVENNKFLFLAP